jgi:hypothetical protein
MASENPYLGSSEAISTCTELVQSMDINYNNIRNISDKSKFSAKNLSDSSPLLFRQALSDMPVMPVTQQRYTLTVSFSTELASSAFPKCA